MTKRSSHEWAVIAMTIALAIYFGAQVAQALLILGKAGATSAYSAYIPAGIIIAVFLVAAWYQPGIVLSGVQLLLLVPGLWQVTEILAKRPDWTHPAYSPSRSIARSSSTPRSIPRARLARRSQEGDRACVDEKQTMRLSAWLVLLFIPMAAACAAPTEIKWTEEVRLHDGKVIQLKRRTELSPTGFPTSSRGKPIYHELCYAPMGIYWKSNPAYEPELFDVVDGKAYVRVPLRGCNYCKLHDFPKTNSVHFVWDGGKWRQIDAAAFPSSLRFNLLSAAYSDDDGAHDARGLISLADKTRRDATLYQELGAIGGNSLTDRKGHRDLCERCSRMSVKTNAPREVLLPSKAAGCNW